MLTVMPPEPPSALVSNPLSDTRHAGRPYRVLFAFDPKRCAILLTGGDKTEDRWYEEFVPIADRLYDEHLAALRKEKRNNG